MKFLQDVYGIKISLRSLTAGFCSLVVVGGGWYVVAGFVMFGSRDVSALEDDLWKGA